MLGMLKAGEISGHAILIADRRSVEKCRKAQTARWRSSALPSWQGCCGILNKVAAPNMLLA
jgi:hypothetical protein